MIRNVVKSFFTNTAILYVVCLCGCQCNVFQPTPDSELFADVKFEPLEWKDNYILATTWNPAQIQVWDEENGKLVQTYDLEKKIDKPLEKGTVALWVMSMTQKDGNIWFVGEGQNMNLIRLTTETGKMKFIKLDCNPSSVCVVPNDGTEKGSLWCATTAARWVGFYARQIDDDGNILKKCDVQHDDIFVDSSDIGCLRYMDGSYYLLCDGSDYVSDKIDKNIFRLVDLGSENEQFVTELPFSSVFPEGFLQDTLDVVPKDILTSLSWMPYFDDEKNVYVTANAIGHISSDDDYKDICSRFLFRLKSLKPFNVEYTGIMYDEPDARSIYHVAENSENIFMTGRVLHDDDNFNGLETGVYPVSGGEQIRRIRMLRANQLHATTRNGRTWFSKDIYYQVPPAYDEWDKSGKPEIYMLEHSTGRVFRYSSDGTRIEIKPETSLQ